MPIPTDIVIHLEDPRWETAIEDIDQKIRYWVSKTLEACGQKDAEIAVVCLSDERMAAFNKDFRSKEGATNVLSFPAAATSEEPELGDILLGYDTIQNEAGSQGKAFDEHVAHLLVHGCLHLLGYDHNEQEEAAEMEARETELLAGFGIPDPYQSRIDLMEMGTQKR